MADDSTNEQIVTGPPVPEAAALAAVEAYNAAQKAGVPGAEVRSRAGFVGPDGKWHPTAPRPRGVAAPAPSSPATSGPTAHVNAAARPTTPAPQAHVEPTETAGSPVEDVAPEAFRLEFPAMPTAQIRDEDLASAASFETEAYNTGLPQQTAQDGLTAVFDAAAALGPLHEGTSESAEGCASVLRTACGSTSYRWARRRPGRRWARRAVRRYRLLRERQVLEQRAAVRQGHQSPYA